LRSVRIRTPARLHFGLFADGRGERKFGGVGMAIDKPCFDLSIQFDERDNIYSWIDPSLKPRIEKLLARLRERFDVSPVRIDVEEFIPHHVGLGSGTQLALAVGNATTRLARLFIRPDQMASYLGRGKRSGIGFHASYQDGVIIDAGKSNDDEVAPILRRSHFPKDWRIVLIRPPLDQGIHGTKEIEAFQEKIVIPRETTERLSSIALNELAPACDAGDFKAFSEAVYLINRLSGECFAPVQGGVYAHPRLEEIVADSRKLGCLGVGQSSWGPTLFAIQQSEDAARVFIEQLAEMHPDADVWIAKSEKDPYCNGVIGTRLLVSVRSPEEAIEALTGGVDLIDVKEPTRGPLGAADVDVRNRILDLFIPDRTESAHGFVIQPSLAFGELSGAERRINEDPEGFNEPNLNYAFSIQTYVKIGFAGERRRTDWNRRFLELPERFFRHRHWGLNVIYVPVAYADHENANAPNWHEIVDRICKKQGEWRYLLLDTFSKQTNFWDALGGKEGVRELFDVCEKEHIHLALAGSLKADDIDRLADEIGKLPHIIAVRGAACKDGIRTNPIDRNRVAELRRRIIAAELRLDRRRPPRSCG
jgi:beta-ribofuranosylaminobenzene 5'-phosphate synthase